MMKPTPSRGLSMAVLVALIFAALAAGAVGSIATFSSVRTWYPLLHKPMWNPPAWLFGPVWTTLYGLMGTAVWRAWRSGAVDIRRILQVYALQLTLNALWSVAFFGLRAPGWALVDIGILWLLLLWLQAALWRADRRAGALWLPYLLWVSFAATLNLAIVRLN